MCCDSEPHLNQELCYTRYFTKNNDRLLRIRRAFCHEHHRHRRQGRSFYAYNTNDDLHVLKIIVRARQNHLFSQYRNNATTLSADLLSQVSEAWKNYVRENVSKGLPDEERPSIGEEETKWPRIAEIARDGSRKLECLKRDEKFDMHFTAAVRVSRVLPLNAYHESSNTESDICRY